MDPLAPQPAADLQRLADRLRDDRVRLFKLGTQMEALEEKLEATSDAVLTGRDELRAAVEPTIANALGNMWQVVDVEIELQIVERDSWDRDPPRRDASATIIIHLKPTTPAQQLPVRHVKEARFAPFNGGPPETTLVYTDGTEEKTNDPNWFLVNYNLATRASQV
jgi:hypothetical protein